MPFNITIFIKYLENETFPSSRKVKKGYKLHKMASLVFYSYARGFTEAVLLQTFADNHAYIKFVANEIIPDEDIVNNFINK